MKVGYAFSNRVDTNLTIWALQMAVQRQHPQPGLIFHSDRGVHTLSLPIKAFFTFQFSSACR